MQIFELFQGVALLIVIFPGDCSGLRDFRGKRDKSAFRAPSRQRETLRTPPPRRRIYRTPDLLRAYIHDREGE